MQNLKFTQFAYLILASCLFLGTCKKKEKDPEPAVVVEPKAPPVPIPVFQGNFSNMINDTVRISMEKNLVNSAYGGNSKVGYIVDKTNLENMFYNLNDVWSNPNLRNKPSIKISEGVNPTSAAFKDSLVSYFTRISNASKSTTTASDGQAGVLKYQSSAYGKLFDARGFAVDELIEKGLMGSVQLYQMCAVLLTDAKLTTSDKTLNSTNWDYAYAQLGIPLDYGNKDYYYSIPLWGKYLKVNDQKLGSVSKILYAFVEGRKGIMDGDNSKVMANATIIKNEMENVTAGMVLTSLYNARYYNDKSALAERNRALTEVLGFLHILQNHPTKKISDTQLQGLINKLNINNWTISMSTVDAIVSEFKSVYPNINTSTYIDPNLK
ncbi:MAG: DUF4856 domain-containing protein [Opitutaceae bacterium]|nr:DUF4856 domain-containing protein [Cytophagales bacterium]